MSGSGFLGAMLTSGVLSVTAVGQLSRVRGLALMVGYVESWEYDTRSY